MPFKEHHVVPLRGLEMQVIGNPAATPLRQSNNRTLQDHSVGVAQACLP
jgi:hypothetical protein